MKPTTEWLRKYEKVKHLLKPTSDLNSYFTSDEIAGMKLKTFSMGKVHFPTGEILVRDPLVFISEDEEPYFQRVPAGVYDLKICAVLSDDDCARYAAAMVAFSDKEPVEYYEALIGDEDLDDAEEEGDFFGFAVDAGLGTIIDVKTRDAFLAFEKKLQAENPDFDNMYDDFFSDLLEKSWKDNPEFQRSGGDWLNWTIPDTDLSLPIFQTGFGDGAYPVYFGYDADDNICRVVVELIDIMMAYGDEDK